MSSTHHNSSSTGRSSSSSSATTSASTGSRSQPSSSSSSSQPQHHGRSSSASSHSHSHHHSRPSSSTTTNHHHHSTQSTRSHHTTTSRSGAPTSTKPSSSSSSSSTLPNTNANSTTTNTINTSFTKEQLSKIEPFQLQKRKTAFQCPPLKFQCALPEPRIETKVLNFSFDLKRFIPYKTTSLEQNYKFLLLTEPDVGIPIDLINPNTYATTSSTHNNSKSHHQQTHMMSPLLNTTRNVNQQQQQHLDDEDRVLLGMEPLASTTAAIMTRSASSSLLSVNTPSTVGTPATPLSLLDSAITTSPSTLSSLSSSSSTRHKKRSRDDATVESDEAEGEEREQQQQQHNRNGINVLENDNENENDEYNRVDDDDDDMMASNIDLDDYGPEAEVAHTERLFRMAQRLDAEFAQFKSSGGGMGGGMGGANRNGSRTSQQLKLLRHPSNPQLKPVEMVPLIPDEELWGNTFVRVMFDSDPIPKAKLVEYHEGYDKLTNPVEQRRVRDAVSHELYKSAMILSRETDPGMINNLVHYLLPKKRRSATGQNKRRKLNNDVGGGDENNKETPSDDVAVGDGDGNGNDDDGEQVEQYETVREYVLDMAGINPDDTSMEEHFFMIMDKEAKQARYNALGRSRLQLTSKSVRFGGSSSADDYQDETRVGAVTLVTHRDYTETEIENRENKRSHQLYGQ